MQPPLRPWLQGTGLGLAISAETARRHGGSLRLVPKPGRGATFQLRLPLEDAERDGTSPELTAPVVPAEPLAAAERF